MLGMCIYFFFQIVVTVTCKCGVVKTPTERKLNQTSCIWNMRCTCAKNNTVCTAKCRGINCGNGKLSIQSVKRRKREPPLLTSSLSSKASLEYLLNSEEERERSWITRFQHFILESMLYITLKDMNGKLGVFKEGSSQTLLKIIGRIMRKKIARQSRTWKSRLDDLREMVESMHKERNCHESVVKHWVIVKNVFEDLFKFLNCMSKVDTFLFTVEYAFLKWKFFEM